MASSWPIVFSHKFFSKKQSVIIQAPKHLPITWYWLTCLLLLKITKRTCFYIDEAGVGESSRKQRTKFLLLTCMHWFIFILVGITNHYTEISPENMPFLQAATPLLWPCLNCGPNTVALPADPHNTFHQIFAKYLNMSATLWGIE